MASACSYYFRQPITLSLVAQQLKTDDDKKNLALPEIWLNCLNLSISLLAPHTSDTLIRPEKRSVMHHYQLTIDIAYFVWRTVNIFFLQYRKRLSKRRNFKTKHEQCSTVKAAYGVNLGEQCTLFKIRSPPLDPKRF